MAGPLRVDEVVFAKNNVQIMMKNEPNSMVDGYLTIKKRVRSAGRMCSPPCSPPPSLTAHWIPNEKLARSIHSDGGYTFTVDLGKMRSLRLFYDNDKAKGQLVIASRENHFKVLHFPHGGLTQLLAVLQEWSLCSEQIGKPGKEKETDGHMRTFIIQQVALTDEQYHPEEGMFVRLAIDTWQAFHDSNGAVLNSSLIRRIVFFAGVDDAARPLVWPFLFGFYSFNSTREERLIVYRSKEEEFKEIERERISFLSECNEPSIRQVLRKLECDVLRTDRSSPFYSGEGNPNVECLRELLLNYTVYDKEMSYTQGMSDLLSPILSVLQDKVISFWCFTELMKKSQFLSSPKQAISAHLVMLRELIRLLLPEFYHHLALSSESMELVFCHRWFLLFFKREFNESDLLTLWECLWSGHLTEHFHLFIALAIIGVYGYDVLERRLPADEMLMHFTEQAKSMSSSLVLNHARGFLHQLSQYKLLPCSLESLVKQSKIWEDSERPSLVCSQQCEHTKATLVV